MSSTSFRDRHEITLMDIVYSDISSIGSGNASPRQHRIGHVLKSGQGIPSLKYVDVQRFLPDRFLAKAIFTFRALDVHCCQLDGGGTAPTFYGYAQFSSSPASLRVGPLRFTLEMCGNLTFSQSTSSIGILVLADGGIAAQCYCLKFVLESFTTRDTDAGVTAPWYRLHLIPPTSPLTARHDSRLPPTRSHPMNTWSKWYSTPSLIVRETQNAHSCGLISAPRKAPGSSTKGLSENFRDFGLKNPMFLGSKTQDRTRVVTGHAP
ncbi:hypothetical protein C8R43DRAFT_956480 [Mycena crocata]|nr:hypothetical protein C8R43DRAFT_956480 [Mycena crocata]